MTGVEFFVRQIFEHARQLAPCILIIEDIDLIVTQHVKPFFLNELDGLVQNQGDSAIATTNHPERIDDVILDRPVHVQRQVQLSLSKRTFKEAVRFQMDQES